MRLRILQDTYTVGEFLEAGKMADVQEPLAKSLIAQGKAAEAFPGMTQTTEKLVSSPVTSTPITSPEAVAEKKFSMKPAVTKDKPAMKKAEK